MIKILTTGGTIEGLDSDLGISNRKVSIQKFLENALVSFSYTIENVLVKDSRLICETDLEKLFQKIKASDSDKVLITHGTFTMTTTAEYIGNRKHGKTVVLVGSQISGNKINTDAPFNLGFAISSLQFLKPDVYIAMNGEVFHWSNVTKNLMTNKFERNV